MFSLCSRSLFRGGESGGMKTVIGYFPQVMFGWCRIYFCWEFCVATQAGVLNALIKQGCDYPV